MSARVAATNIPPSGPLSAEDGPQEDELSVKKLTAVLCNGLFSPIDGSVVLQIVRECLDLYAGSKEALGQVLQTRFIGGHTPFYWIIVNLSEKERAQSERACPPLLSKLIKVCGDLLKLAQEDIVRGLLEFSDDGLFQIIKPNLIPIVDHRSSALQDHRPTYKFLKTEASENEFAFSFSIPRFYDHILIDREVVVPFVAMGSLWYLKAAAVEAVSSDGIWTFELTEKRSRRISPPPAQFKRTISTTLNWASREKQCEIIQNVTCITRIATPKAADIAVDKWPGLSNFTPNPFVSHPDRTLSGIIHVYDEVMPMLLDANEV